MSNFGAPSPNVQALERQARIAVVLDRYLEGMEFPGSLGSAGEVIKDMPIVSRPASPSSPRC